VASRPAKSPVPIGAGRLPRTGAAAVWLVVAVDVGLMLALALVPDFPVVFVPVVVGVIGACGVVGAVLGTRIPRNPLGWILLTTGTVAALSLAGAIYAGESVALFGGTLPGTVAIAFLGQYSITPILGAFGVFLLLLFPDGRLPSRRWRPVAWLAGAAITLATIVAAVTPGSMGGSGLPNPLGASGLGVPADAMGLAVTLLLAIPCAAAIASVFVRYRGAGVVGRQQLRLLGWAGVLFLILQWIGSTSLGPMAEYGWVLEVGSMGLLPIAIGVAVLRYRLYDLDRIISRTIGWAVVTGTLVGVFVLTNLGLQALLAPLTGNNTLAVAGSTLLAAALFQPVRGRVQRAVDRRFNRSGDSARRAVVAFASQLRDEVDLDAVRGRLLSTAGVAVQPQGAGLWLRSKAAP